MAYKTKFNIHHTPPPSLPLSLSHMSIVFCPIADDDAVFTAAVVVATTGCSPSIGSCKSSNLLKHSSKNR